VVARWEPDGTGRHVSRPVAPRSATSVAAGDVGHQEVRSQYFVYKMLGRLGARRVRARSPAGDLRVLAAKDRGRSAVLLVNSGLPSSRHVVAAVRFAGLAAGRKRLTVWRVDGTRAWSDRELRLPPAERREVEVRPDFACRVAGHADSVSLVVLEAPR
jgi:hypothetical protein